MTDYRALVERLRENDRKGGIGLFEGDAADAIEALLAENERLRDRVAELESAWVMKQSTGTNAP